MRRILLVLLTAALASGESYPSWWSFASPETSALVGIRWEHLRESPFAEAMEAELLSSGGLGFPDLPCLREANQILVTSPALLATMSGSFPVETLRKQAIGKGFKAANYHGIDLWISPDKATLSVAQVSEQLLLVGARKTIESAIDRHLSETDPAGSGRRYSPLLARAARLAQNQDLWVLSNNLPDPLANRFVPLDVETGSFQGAMSLRDGLQLDATLDAGSEQTATELAEGIRQSIPTLPGIAQGLQVRTVEGAVLLDLDVSREQFAASLRPASAPTAAQLEPSAAPAPLPPAALQMIRIFGLDQGPREIVLPPPGPLKEQ